MQKLLEVDDLGVNFFTNGGILPAVNGVSFTLEEGSILGLVGESGGGKSMVGRSILRLIPESGRIVGGRILFEGGDLMLLSEEAMRGIRGAIISMILQDPLMSLNPAFTIGYQLTDVLMLHKGMTRIEAREVAAQMMKSVGIPDPLACLKKYPHQLSGGMRQRVMIAIAFSCHPKLIIADEPTTALDVTIQAQILQLLKRLKEETGTSILFITHDMGLVAHLCDAVAVMYSGEIVEWGPTPTLFRKPWHPYTRALIKSIPRHDRTETRLCTIEGRIPNLADLPPGCKFAPRCGLAFSRCFQPEAVPMMPGECGHEVRCWLYGDQGNKRIG